MCASVPSQSYNKKHKNILIDRYYWLLAYFPNIIIVACKKVYIFLFDYSDGQNCINNPNISIPGDNAIEDGIQMIMPSFNFNCNGRITATMYVVRRTGSLPVFQV